MSRSTSKFSMKVGTAIAVVALAAPATALSRTDGGGQDLRSPDAIHAAIQAEKAYEAVRLEKQREASGYVDLRSPDAREATTVASPEPAIAPTLEPARIVESSRFDWGDAGIGAGALFGLLLIALSVMFTVVHRRNRTPAL